MVMKENRKKNLLIFLLATVALVWGLGFVFTKQVLNYMSPAMLNICRFVLSSVILLVLFFKKIVKLTKKQWLSGVFAGLIMSLGFGLQTYGVNLTSPSNSALLTGLNVVMVPFFCWAVYKKRPPKKAFASAILAFSSIAFIGVKGFSKLTLGDLLCFLCAVAFAMHFIVLDKITKDADPTALAFVQMLTGAVIFTFIGLVFDFQSLKASTYDDSLILPMFTLCILNTGYAYWVQSNAQTIVSPSTTSLILSCESIIGAIFSVILGLDEFTWYLAVAAIGVTIALFISQIDFKKKGEIIVEDVGEKSDAKNIENIDEKENAIIDSVEEINDKEKKDGD